MSDTTTVTKKYMRIDPGCVISWHGDTVQKAMGGYIQYVGSITLGKTEFSIYADEEGMLKNLNPDAYLAELVRQLGSRFYERYIFGPLVIGVEGSMTSQRAEAIENHVRGVWNKMTEEEEQ